MKKPERLGYEITISVGLPEGTLDEVIKHLTDAHKEAIKDVNNGLYERDGCIISSVEFQEKWYGYEDCQYVLILTYEEPVDVFNSRTVEWKTWKEDKERKDAEDRANWANISKMKEIKDLEKRLAELKGGS